MVGRAIRKLGQMVYHYPKIQEDVTRPGKFGSLKVALVTDSFTTECLSAECRIRSLTRDNYTEVISTWKPDMVFVESVFHGAGGDWRYELARQPKYLRWTPPKAIFKLVAFAKEQGVPAVFWNKDDGAFFDAFIDVARVFDYVFTTDRDCIPKYLEQVALGVPVNTLVMPYQPEFHYFDGFNFTRHEACFTGSYYRRILDERRQFLDRVFDSCERTGVNINIYDRNHDRLSKHLEFKFPKKASMTMHGGVPHRRTAEIYKSHVASINVNSVTGSDTMFSRRLLEIIACGGIAVTNPSKAVDGYFRDFCHVVNSREEIDELLMRLKHGPSTEDKDRAEAGALYAKNNHTWGQRLEELCAIVKI